MDHLDALEAQSIYILREAFARRKKLALLRSLGKDSNALIWLARKAFFVAQQSVHLGRSKMHCRLLKRCHDLLQFGIKKNHQASGKGRISGPQTQEQVTFMKPAPERKRKTPPPGLFCDKMAQLGHDRSDEAVMCRNAVNQAPT
jgi:hypothetical protein